VSATTVSFVLNGKAQDMRISKALEKRILKYVTVKRYKPSSIARSLRMLKNKQVPQIWKKHDNIPL